MKKISKFEYDRLKTREYVKHENGCRQELSYRINWKNEVVEEYYFNDDQIIEHDRILGIADF